MKLGCKLATCCTGVEGGKLDIKDTVASPDIPVV